MPTDATIPPPLSLTRTDDGLSLTLPPVGIRWSHPEVKFAAAFTGILIALTAFFWWLMQGAGNIDVVFTGALVFFWLIALGLLFSAYRIAARHAVIDVIGDTLLITVRMPLSKQLIETEARFIRALGVGPSGVVVDDEPVMALRLDLTKPTRVGKDNKKAIKLFRERPVGELKWVASTLREALHIEKDSMKHWAKDAASSKMPGPEHLHTP